MLKCYTGSSPVVGTNFFAGLQFWFLPITMQNREIQSASP